MTREDQTSEDIRTPEGGGVSLPEALHGGVLILVTPDQADVSSIHEVLRTAGLEHRLVAAVGPGDASMVGQSSAPPRRAWLAARRKELGKSQEKLAREVGVERTTVARWEAGGNEPSVSCRSALAMALEIPLAELRRLLDAHRPVDRPISKEEAA